MSVDRSYLPYKSARDYKDREMAKWMGFFLSEHTANIQQKKKEDEFIYMPLDEMTTEEISELLFEAYKYHRAVEVSLKIIQDGQYVFLKGYVEGLHNSMIILEEGSFRIEVVRAAKFI